MWVQMFGGGDQLHKIRYNTHRRKTLPLKGKPSEDEPLRPHNVRHNGAQALRWNIQKSIQSPNRRPQTLPQSKIQQGS